jgi:acetyl esterase
MTASLHPDAQRLLELMRAAGRPAFETLDHRVARDVYRQGRHVLQQAAAEVALVRDITLPGLVPLRLYRGLGTDPAAALPCLVFLHGGGWVLGDLDTHDTVCRLLANAAGCAVLAVDYRLAPEHAFPAAVEDAHAVLLALPGQAAALGLDPGRLAVGGDSAGGNLAAVLALLTRDGRAPPLRGQLLLYPALDLRGDSASYAAFTTGLPLTRGTMGWFRRHYAPDRADWADWRVSPALAESLAGVAPAFVMTAGFDPLRDEGLAFADRLAAAGVPVTRLHLDGLPHGFLTMGNLIRAVEPVLALAGFALRGWFEPAA